MNDANNKNTTNKTYTNNVEDVIAQEKARIDPARTRENLEADKYVGLAISGGGIRSASFALGVMQSMVWHNKLKQVDYLSTVSGGGYIGSALTWFLNQEIPDWMHTKEEEKKEEGYFGTESHNFPLGQVFKGSRIDNSTNDTTDNAKKPRPNAVLDYIRQHGNYLTPGQGLNGVALVGYVLRAMTVSVTVYLTLLTVLMVMLQSLNLFSPPPLTDTLAGIIDHPVGKTLVTSLSYNWFFLAASLLVVGFLILSFSYSLYTFLLFPQTSAKYQYRVFSQKQIGRLITITLILLVVGSLHIAHDSVADLFNTESMRMPAAGGSMLVGIIGTLWQYRRVVTSARFSRAALVISSAFLIYGMCLTAYWFAEEVIISPPAEGAEGILSWPSTSTLVWSLALLLLSLLFGLCVNVNYLGMHRMYRDRLMETFLPDFDAVQKNRWQPASSADTATIDKLCNHNPRPFHLINTNIVLVDSEESQYRGRGGDNFILSPLYCGSNATGWCASKQYMRGLFRKGMTLATAMAISGAALNPNSAVAGRGITRSRVISTLLSLLNLRLGFWAPHPDPKKKMVFPPNFLHPSLTGGILSGGLNERRHAIELSDGGHFENLALYELLRRRLSVIICTDGGADPSFQFGDLGNLVEKTRVDFGTIITFEQEDYCLENLLPGTGEDDYFVEKYNGAKNGFAVGRIRYPDGTEGALIYIKTTLIKGLSADILGYKTANPSFPDQSTTDQFFDETQFEAYRELGYYLGHRMLEENEKQQWF